MSRGELRGDLQQRKVKKKFYFKDKQPDLKELGQTSNTTWKDDKVYIAFWFGFTKGFVMIDWLVDWLSEVWSKCVFKTNLPTLETNFNWLTIKLVK